jgi:hypothetical protein
MMPRMIEARLLQAYTERGNRYLFHVTPAENVEAIHREGLRPGSEIGKSTRDDFFKTRPGHVYLIRQSDLLIVEVGPEPRLFRVDLTLLDPALVDPDEDMVSERFADAIPGEAPNRLCDEHGSERSGQEGVLAAWAESTPDFDSPELAARSLEEGRISYRGTIPSEALELIDTPSTTLIAFAAGLPPRVGMALPDPPPAGDWRVEVARARALVREVVRRICEIVGHPSEIRVDDVYKCRDTWRVLQSVIRALFQEEGRLEAGDAVAAAQEAINMAQELGDPPFPLQQQGLATEVAGEAAKALQAALQVPELNETGVIVIAKESVAVAAAVAGESGS